jgi:hypothetical protein
MEEHRLRVFEIRMLRRIFGLQREKQQEAGENCTIKIFMICQMLLG